MKDHTTHFDDCGCLSEKKDKLIEALLDELKETHREYMDNHKIGYPPKIGCPTCELIAEAEKK